MTPSMLTVLRRVSNDEGIHDRKANGFDIAAAIRDARELKNLRYLDAENFITPAGRRALKAAK